MTEKSFFKAALIFCATAVSLSAENTNSFIFIDMGQSGRAYCNETASYYNPTGYTRPSLGGTVGRFVGMSSASDASIDGVSIGNGLIDLEVNDTTYGARQINRGVGEVLRWIKWLHPEKDLVYIDLATSGTGIAQLMNNADTERRHINQRAILDHVETNYGSPDAVIISWYGNDGATFDSYRREWMPYWTGTQLDGTTHLLGTTNPVSTRNPAAPVDVCWYDSTAAIDQRGRGDVTRLTKIAHVMHPNDNIDPASRAEFQAFHNDSRILPASLGADHFQPMSGHAERNDEWEQPLVSIQTLGSSLLRALGHSYQPPRALSVTAAPDGSYADVTISLPNGGTLTTVRSQSGIPMPALPDERHIEIFGFELVRNGVAVGSRARLRRVDSAAAENIKAAVAITDAGSGSGTNRTATVRITPQTPFAEGDRLCYLMGGMGDTPAQAEQPFFSLLIEEVPELRQPGQPFTFPGFIVASSDTALDINILSAPPGASFSAVPSSGTVPLTVTFTDTSNLSGITNRYWDFGDGFTTNTVEAAVVHIYTEAGTNTVALIVSGSGGSDTNTQINCVVASAPVAPAAAFDMSVSSGPVPLPVTFTDTSTGTITSRYWNFGDGVATSTVETTVTHTYTAAGVHTVELIVSGPAGLSTNSSTVTVTAPEPPSAAFNAAPVSGTAPLTVTFTDNSTGSITNRYWDFGDGTSTNTVATTVTHTYTAAGTNTVELVVSGSAGQSTHTQINLIRVTASAVSGTLYKYEGFDYAANTALRTQTGYTYSGSGGFPTNRTGSLSYSGLPDSTGGKVQIYGQRTGTAGVTHYRTWSDGVPNGETVTNLFASFILNVASVGTIQSNQYIFAIRNATGQIMITNNASDPSKYDIGIFQQVGKTARAWDDNGGSGYDLNTSYLIVVSYTNKTADTYSSEVWINPALSADPPAARLQIPQLYNNNAYNQYTFGTGNGNPAAGTEIYVDELRYGSTWSSVIPAGSSEPPDDDADDDGIPDEWEQRHFGGSTNADPHAMAANGRNTIREAYVAGLDPTNAQSVFAVSGIRNTLEWNAASGRVYSVYWTTNLLEGFQSLQTNILWPQNSWTGQVDSLQSGGFYKVEVRLAP